GWIARVPKQSGLPKIGVVKGPQQLTGYIKLADRHHFILGNNILNSGHWPLLIQRIDIKALRQVLNVAIYPFVMRLDKTAKHGFIRQWQPINVLPQRHLGYAVQWFGLALVLLLTFIFFSRKKAHD
ncbi:MAG: SURF1 family protein, partial [Gammaproteobacteria bacterium]|nr:SURF1 family protein [Gammaproteobacteria bacterium]